MNVISKVQYISDDDDDDALLFLLTAVSPLYTVYCTICKLRKTVSCFNKMYSTVQYSMYNIPSISKVSIDNCNGF